MATLRRSQVERLFSYFHYLFHHHEGASVSSATLSEFLEIDATQVRKDLAAAGIRGCPRVGYPSNLVLRKIARVLGLEERRTAVIVGAGRLGGAIAQYAAFENYGLRFIALFDRDSRKVGTRVAGLPVHAVARLKSLVKKYRVSLGVITVPVDSAQEVADRLIDAGVLAIWNFAHTPLVVPGDVCIRHEHISTGIAELMYHLRTADRQRGGASARRRRAPGAPDIRRTW